MSYRRFWIAIFLAAFLAVMLPCMLSAEVPSPRIDPADMKNIMLVKDVRPGMMGYGKTVFHGTKIETFQVEVIGVLKKANLGTDLVIVKMSGGPMTSRGANLIQGMSGSPVYINGKIMGAFAYGEAFVKEPIGLVTPIEYMLDAWDPALPSKPSTFFPFSASNLEKSISLSGRVFNRATIDWNGASKESFSDGTLVFRPLATPFFASGISPRVLSMFQDEFRELNIRPVAGPGPAADKAHLDIDLQPGSAIGVSLVTGDLDLSGVGTVTYRRGNKVLAFGHPMLGVGALDAYMTTAYVYDVNPSLYVSSKLAAPVKPIGRLSQDRPWAVAGEIGKMPKMIPVLVHLSDLTTGRKREFKAEVMNHPLLNRLLIPITVAEAVAEMRPTPGDSTTRVKFQVEAEEVGAITRENTFFSAMTPEAGAISELMQLLSTLQANPFYPVNVKSITMWVDVSSEHSTARLERIFLKEGRFEPGSTVEVGAVLRPFKGDRVTKTITLTLPKNMPAGKLPLIVGGGTTRGPEMVMEGVAMLPGGESGMPAPTVDNLSQLIKKFLERDKNNELVARVLLPKPVPSVAGEKLSGLPPSIAEAMKSSKSTAIGAERDELKVVLPTDWIIMGTQRLNLTVSKPSRSEKKSPDRSAPEPPAPSPSDMPPPEPQDIGDVSDMDFSGGYYPSEPTPMAVMPVATPTSGQEAAPRVSEPNGPPSTPGSESSKEPGKETSRPAEEKPVGRAPITWKQTSRAEFLAGVLENVAATTDDLLVLSGALKSLCETPEAYVWSLLPDGKGGVYAGTGNRGIVYRVAADGTTSVVYDSPELQVHSLAMDSAGNLYAGSSPNGIVYKIDPDGNAVSLLDADEKYITALAVDGSDNVYAATGDACKVYRITPDGNSTLVLDTSESHALSLAVGKDNTVYVGAGLNGIIYRISPDGKATVIYDAAEDSVSALAVDSRGNLWAGTSAKGVIYKLAPDALPKVVYDKAGKGILGLSADASGNLYAVNAAGVLRILPDDTVATLDNSKDLQFLSVACGNGRVYAGTGNIGGVLTSESDKTLEGVYESPVHDCGLTSTWGAVSWTADTPGGSSVAFQTRTGFVAEPDSTWSDWSAPVIYSGQPVLSPQGRYIQYRATLKAGDSSPRLKNANIVYLPRNQAPKVTISSPKGGERWSKKKTIQWKGADPDKDTLIYEIFYSTDDGTTWKPLGNKISTVTSGREQPKPEKSKSEPEEAVRIDFSNKETALAAMSAELDKILDMPQEMKDQIMAEASAELEDIEEEAEDIDPEEVEVPELPSTASDNSSGNGTKQTSFAWDTSKFADGAYIIKVVASDRLSNPVGDLTGEAISEPVVISNKNPMLMVFKTSITIQANGSARFDGVAGHDLVGIAGVQYRIGGEEWASAAATDGIFDTPFESFTVTTQPLAKGQHTVEVKAIDQAGNSSTTKVKVKID